MLEQLEVLLAAGGLSLRDTQRNQLQRYHEMLLDWNQRMDLTNVPEEEMALKHYADSLLVLSKAEWFPQGVSLIDVGTGAGFPGLPIAILRPDMEICLLDALKKRCSFLEAVVEELGLQGVSVQHARAEDAARGALRERHDLAAARALAPLRVLVEYLLPFVRPGGRALCWKGPSLDTEAAEAGHALEKLGAVMGERLQLPLPDREHYIQALEKKTATAACYPRRAGLPSRKPL